MSVLTDQYDEIMDDLGFVAEHPKKDMSDVNRIRVNGKLFVAIDRVLEIIDSEVEKAEGFRDCANNMSGSDYYDTLAEGMEIIRAAVKALQEGEKE